MAKKPPSRNGNRRTKKPITVGKRYGTKPTNRSSAKPTKKPASRPQTKRIKKASPKSFWRRALKRLFYWSFVAGLWGALAGAILLGILAGGLPDTSGIWDVERQPSITFLDRNGTIIAVQGAAYAPPVELDNVPPELINAVLSVEDRRFYSHFGVDPIGLVRAAYTNAKAGRIVQGGSTLTQQLAKNLFLSSERTYKRKAQEVMLAIWLEYRFSKQEILSLYLNRVYFGRGAWGVEAASYSYFGKPAAQLELGEAAMIAGLLKAPNRYSPSSDISRAERRATIVLDVMVKNEKITPQERDIAFAKPIMVRPSKATPSASYFVDWLAPKVRRLVGEVKTDLMVTTTLDLNAQRAAERSLLKFLTDEQADKNAGQAALVALDPTGAVLAMAGGRSYAQSQFNRATQARRQPGSAFKPFVYLAALEAGLTPDTLRDDAPISIGDWSPRNYKEEFQGPMTLTDALAGSINTIAVQLAEETGRRNVTSIAHRVGITSPLANTRSMSLGSNEVSLIELTAAYAPFANGGYLAQGFGILQIDVRNGPQLWRKSEAPPAKVLDDQNLSDMNLMLQTVVREGTGRQAKIWKQPVAGKTGTTNDFRDAWFIGYVQNQTAGVWVGDDKNRKMDHVTGGGLPAQIWQGFMVEWLQSMPVEVTEPTEPITPEITVEPEVDELQDLLSSLAEKLE